MPEKETLAQMFPSEFCEISKNSFFTEHLRETASELRQKRWSIGALKTIFLKISGDFRVNVCEINVMRCAICYHLYNLKNVKNTHGGVLILVKLQASACNFTTINTRPWVFFASDMKSFF